MMTMKKFAALLVLLVAVLALSVPAFAAGESADASAAAPVTTEEDVTSAKAMASGVMIGIACLGGALAMGIAVSRSSEAIARQPEASGTIRTAMMLLGLVFIETVIIYALIVAILIIFVL